MLSPIVKLSRITIAVIAGLALTAGAYTVTPRSSSSCPVSPPHLLGACTSHQHCQEMCDTHWEAGTTQGVCNPHPETGELCCACMLL
jgi:hypothetical protein